MFVGIGDGWTDGLYLKNVNIKYFGNSSVQPRHKIYIEDIGNKIRIENYSIIEQKISQNYSDGQVLVSIY